MIDLNTLPQEISKYIINKNIEENLIGCESGNVYKIIGIEDILYLKVKEFRHTKKLEIEFNKTSWLYKKFNVPKMINYSIYSNKEFLLMEELKGYMSDEYSYFDSKEQIIKLIAKALRKFHSISINNCPFINDMEKKLIDAKFNIENSLVDEEDFNDENIGKNVNELYQELLDLKPKSQDLVLTHGDYCMPNIIIDKDLNVGFIDLGRFGIADRYQDISLIIRSFEHNFNTQEYNDLFFHEYGIKNIDYNKLKFYNLLDEFF